MNINQARDSIKEVFTHGFDKEKYRLFIRNLLNELDESDDRQTLWTQGRIKDAFKDYINHFERLATYTDPDGDKLDILVIYIKKDHVLERARTLQRNFIADYLTTGHGQDKSAVLAAFVAKSGDVWRFSYIKRDYRSELNEKNNVVVKTDFTPARRYSFLVGPSEPCHTAQGQFLPLLENDTKDPLLSEIENAFMVERVTAEFFTQYKHLLIRMKDGLEEVLKSDENVRKEFESKDINAVDFVKKLLGQIVFLYFLQKKGWFGVARKAEWGTGPKDYLRQLFINRHKLCGHKYNSPQDVNFFNDILEPLFYDALAKGDRDADWYDRFQCRIPFLNGGLFDPIGFYDWVNTDIVLPDALFSNDEKTPSGDNGTGILDIFDRYNFTVQEDEPLEKEVAIDPEFLGKVFERLNAISQKNFKQFCEAESSGQQNLIKEFNKKNGVYYTPREVVHYMCQQALSYHLQTAMTGKCSKEDIETFIYLGEQSADFEARITKEHKDKRLPESVRKNAKEIDETLANIAVCDPAIGSGAFPVGMLTEIVKLRSVLIIVLGAERSRYELKRHAIQSSIYGVDLDSGAVDIAKLRLWLSLVVDEDDIKQIKPLPNLDYKIMQGNSLLDQYRGIKLFDDNLLNLPDLDDNAQKEALKQKISKLQSEYIALHSGGELTKVKKLELDKELTRSKKNLQAFESRKNQKDQQEDWTDQEKKSVKMLRLLKEKHTEFFNAEARNRKKELKDELDTLEWAFMEATLHENRNDEALQELQNLRNLSAKPFFLWKLHFAEVFQSKGGFDIVIGNPPFVRQEEIKEFKKAFEQTYNCYTGMADLFVYFYERGHSLLKDDGILTFISSNKYFRSGYGEKLREFLATRSKILQAIDFGDASVFEATAYPSIVVLQKSEFDANETRVMTWEPGPPLDHFAEIFREKSFTIQQTELKSDGWLLESPAVLRLLEKLRNAGTPLGEYVKGRFYRGVLTGLNEAFVVDRETRDRLIAEDKSSADVLKPFLRGRDVKRWRCNFADKYLIKIESSENIKHPWSDKNEKDAEEIFSNTYPAIYNWFNGMRKVLRNRYDQGKYFWELRSCAYWQEFEQQKIIYPDIYEHQSFAWDEDGYYSVNTTYFIPTDQKWLCGLLNSKTIEWFYSHISNKVRGGYMRAFSDYMKQIPIPTVAADQQKQIANLVDQILAASQSGPTADVSGLEAEIDQLVYELYGLTKEEIAIVEGA